MSGALNECIEDPRADKILQLQQRPVVEYPVRAGDRDHEERATPAQGFEQGMLDM